MVHRRTEEYNGTRGTGKRCIVSRIAKVPWNKKVPASNVVPNVTSIPWKPQYRRASHSGRYLRLTLNTHAPSLPAVPRGAEHVPSSAMSHAQPSAPCDIGIACVQRTGCRSQVGTLDSMRNSHSGWCVHTPGRARTVCDLCESRTSGVH